MRKIFIFIGIAVAILLIAGVAYYAYVSKSGSGGLGQSDGTVSAPNFFPFGNNNEPVETPIDEPVTPIETPIVETPITNTETPRLVKIVAKPVAGFVYTTTLREKKVEDSVLGIDVAPTIGKDGIPSNFERVPAIRYVEKETGNIYDLTMDALQTKRLSNTTIPRIHEAIFSGNGSHVFLRYLEDDNRTIATYAAKVPEFTAGGDGEGKITGSFLERGIRDLVASPDGTKIFYTVPFGTGLSGVLAEKDGSKPGQIFSSAFVGWLPYFSGKSTVELTTKASAYAQGFTYTLDTASKSFNKIIGSIGGLVAKLSPDGKYLAYSNSVENGTILRVLDIAKQTATNTNLRTFPEKCSFSSVQQYLYCGVPTSMPTGVYPDSWYQGSVNFADSIWRIDPKGRIIDSEIIRPLDLGFSVDATNIYVDDAETYLFFINRNDGSVWRYSLKVQ